MQKRIMLILEAGAEAPEWIHLLAMGELPITKEPGFIRVDARGLDNILQAWRRRGNDLVIDYEHQTLGGGEAPAAGWIKEMEARPDGLWARVEWNDKAAAYLRNREYRYFSPVLDLDEENRPLELYNAALTNSPAITNLPPLVATSREGLDVADMEKCNTSRAQAQGNKSEEDKATMLTQLKSILGLKAEAQEGEIITAVQQFQGQTAALKGAMTTALGLKAEATAEEITAAIGALKTDQGKLTSLEAEVAALKDREASRAAEALVEAALKDGKLTPAERELMIADAKRDPDGFKQRLAVRPKLVPIGDRMGVLKDGGQGGSEGEPGPEAPVDRRLAFKAQKLASEKNLDLATAQAQALKENPELAREWQQSTRMARA